MKNLINRNDELDDSFYENIKIVKKWNDGKADETGVRPTYHKLTYGCQMNEHDSEKMGWILELMGYEETFDEDKADFVLFNTCAIRDNAEQKVYGKIGSFKTEKENRPGLKVAVCGCMMQLNHIRETIEKSYRHVDLVFGTHNIHMLPELLAENIKTDKMVVDVMEDNLDLVEGIGASREHSFKGYVNITYGCDNFCTYCVVPYARGREISRQKEDILREIKKLAASGTKEIMLLGQNVNSYGKTLEDKVSFAELLREISEIEGLERIRFMTSHPKDISDELLELYGELDNLSNHLHLPIQSGSNRVLKAMNRGYTREDYLEKVRKIREISPDISLSTDIIVGFPGETEEEFQETLSLIKEVEYEFVYNFIFSERKGTKAADMDGHLDYEVKHDRFERLSEAINEIALKNNEKLLGGRVSVLLESKSKNDDAMLSGRTDDFKLVHVKGDESLIGKIVDVKVIDAGTFSLTGEVI